IVQSLSVDAGDAVQAGQGGAGLGKEGAEARGEEARAKVLASPASAGRAHTQGNPSDRAYAGKELARRRTLRESGLVAPEELERTKKDFDLTQMRYDGARATAQMAEAQVVEAEAGLERAENELRYATIVSPLTGVVLSRDVDVGSGVSAGGTAPGGGNTGMTGGGTRGVDVVGVVRGIDIGRGSLRMPARMQVESFPGRVFDGEVTKISPQGAEKDKVISFEIEVAIRGDATGLRPLMTADADVVVAEKADVRLIPEAAIIRENGLTYIE